MEFIVRIPPSPGLGEAHLRVVLHREALVSGAELAVPAGKGKIDVEAFHPKDTESLSHVDDVAELGEHPLERLRGKTEDLDVEVPGLETEEAVANVPAHDESPAARSSDHLGYPSSGFEGQEEDPRQNGGASSSASSPIAAMTDAVCSVSSPWLFARIASAKPVASVLQSSRSMATATQAG